MNASEQVVFSQSIPRGIEIIDSFGSVVKFFFQVSSFNKTMVKIWDGAYANGTFVPDGVYTVNTTMTDYSGNTDTTFVSTIYIDNSPPLFSNFLINPNAPNEIQDVEINATVSESNNLTRIFLEFKGINYISPSNNLDEYYFTISFGNYTAHDTLNYSWFANDSLGNFNNSVRQFFTIANRPPIFNGTITGINFTENGNTQQFNISSYFYDLDAEDTVLTFGPSTLQNFKTV